jgi:predicted DNA-binding transcriptional regulator YafY
VENIVHPYLLKMYQQRWFLVGHIPTQAELRVFALDGIADSTPASLSYVPAAVDFETYFQHVIGPTVPPGEEPTTVRLRFAHGRAPYVLTKPLHLSQRTVADTEAGVELTLRVVPNPELVTQLLSFGADVEILAPAKLRATIQKRLRVALARYGD